MFKTRFILMLALLMTAVTGAVAQNYTITLPSVSNGSVAAKVNDTPVTSAAAGETVSLVATPDAGYKLKTISATSNISETFSSGANTRTGTYFSVSGSNYNYGWRIGNNGYTLTISSLSNQDLSQVVLTVGTAPNVSQRNISHLQADHGTLSATGTTQGNTITITGINSPTVTVSAPSSGNSASMWSITQAKIDGLGSVALTLTDTSDDNVKTFTMPSGNVTVSAEFESAVVAGYTVTLKEGTEDATSWTIAPAEATTTGVAAGTEVKATYNGAKKVKSVKAVKKAKPAATVTTAPTAKTGVKAGEDVAIVNEGTAEGGTMMYMVNATQPASTDGFSATVPTAEGLTAGTYYVWYYVKADDSHTDSEISATGIEVTIAAAAPTLAETINTAGMTVKVNFNYDGANYCSFLSNGNGTYTFQSGYGWAGGDENQAKALVVEGGKLVFKQSSQSTIDDEWNWSGYSVTFDTSNNTYTQWAADNIQLIYSPSFISVEVNGTQIAVTAAQ